MITFDLLNDGTKEDIKNAIQHIAIYPRRSRKSEENKHMSQDEIEKDLLHQSKRLKQICEKNNWSYEDYTEIGSGENIDDRPKLIQLLEDLEKGHIDGISITELSRLTRGGGKDMDRILLALRRTSTVVIEGDGNILNPFNKFDLDRFKMMGMMSNFEYSGYVERVIQGKRVRASEGWWVGGIPPYGYIRDHKTKKLVIDEEKGEIYREMILLPYLNGLSTSEVAWNLNKAKIPSPRGGLWGKDTVLRMLKDETYCGTLIYNKTMGSRKSGESVNRMPFRKIDEDRWSKAYNAHPSLKSYEEHQSVLNIIKSRARKKENITIHPLSGMVKCSNCDRSMIISNSIEKPRFLKCKCGGNSGGETEVVENIIFVSALKLKEQLLEVNENESNRIEKQHIIAEIEKLENKIDKENKALHRIDEGVTYGYFTFQQATEKKDGILKLVYELEERVSRKKKQLESFNVISNKEKIKRIDMFMTESNSNQSSEDLRNMYTTIINNIIWNKVDSDTLEIKVNFL